uniref:bis(5'-nucleosyl)-tetraphosphatase (symmetrical) n=1 Tax=uncultured bacterium HF186_25m_18N5 TaxID=662887 RepID=C7FPE2_9BACT|nr:diadenosine tetraphosphatase [uncultured bacterium HF186_25m_18N5]
MAVYAVGDVQGSFQALSALVGALNFNPKVDQLWLAGDLVNRGPDSLEVLRWAYQHRDALRVVLGNHDLYLIGRWLGALRPKARDTLEPLLKATDADTLIGWLRAQPLLVQDGRWLMVHAALHPEWELRDAHDIARELEELLQSEQAADLLRDAHRSTPTGWSRDQDPHERRLAALATLTRLRCLDPTGALTFDYSGPLNACPPDRVPWWRATSARCSTLTVIIGHWAALGYHRAPGLLALDTGCAWGKHLTAVELMSGRVTQVSHDGSLVRADAWSPDTLTP